MSKCEAILKSGNRKGQVCGNALHGTYENKHFCGVHKNLIVDNGQSSTQGQSEIIVTRENMMNERQRREYLENTRIERQNRSRVMRDRWETERENRRRERREQYENRIRDRDQIEAIENIMRVYRTTQSDIIRQLIESMPGFDQLQEVINRSLNDVREVTNPVTDLESKTTVFKCESDDNCAICQEGMKDNEVRKVGCNHMYHKECIDKWFERSNTCPVCRHNV